MAIQKLSDLNVREILYYQNSLGISKKFDATSDADYTYIGRAVPGSATSDSVWQIKRIENATGDVTWALGTDDAGAAEGAGNSSFNKIWDNRLTYTFN